MGTWFLELVCLFAPQCLMLKLVSVAPETNDAITWCLISTFNVLPLTLEILWGSSPLKRALLKLLTIAALSINLYVYLT